MYTYHTFKWEKDIGCEYTFENRRIDSHEGKQSFKAHSDTVLVYFFRFFLESVLLGLVYIYRSMSGFFWVAEKQQTKTIHEQRSFKSSRFSKQRENTGSIRFEISSQKLKDLLLHGQICAADIRCLDAFSKQCLKDLCLKTCLHGAVIDTAGKERCYRKNCQETGLGSGWEAR